MARQSSLQARRWFGNLAMGKALTLQRRRANIIECKAWKDKAPFRQGIRLAIWPWAKHWPCNVVGRTLSSAGHGKTKFPPNQTLVWQFGHGRSTDLTMSSGEHHRVQGMERRSSLQTRSSGLEPASSAYGATTAFPAMFKQHDRCDNIVEAGTRSLGYVAISILKGTATMARGASAQYVSAMSNVS